MILTLAFTTAPINMAVAADKKTSVSQADKKAELQKNLKEINKKLKTLGEESKETEEYIATLDQKIQYLNQQYDLAKKDVEAVETKVSNLETRISKNEESITTLTQEIASLEITVKTLNEEFADTYDDYCQRIKAIYVSGDHASTLSFLLTSDGIQNLLTRLEMVRSISKRDGELMDSVKKETAVIVETKNKLDNKKDTLTKAQTELKSDRNSLQTEQVTLKTKQDDLAKQQATIEEQQQEANTLLKNLNDKTKEYGEYRDITQEELDEIDDAIAAADKKYAQVTTTTKKQTTTKKVTTTKKKTTTTTKRTTTTTKKPSTTQKSTSTTNKSTTTTKKTTTTTTTTKPSTTTTTATTSGSKYISLTYPCPAFKTITCGFGAYSGHTGCDFSTQGKVDQKIVAAEAGTVIISTDLTNSDGSYRSYGRYIVIRHDKTTSSGKIVYTLYAHNNSRLVSEGQHVSKGQQIAKSGSTGNSTGPHCHFEVRVGGSSQSYAVNPKNYLP